MILTFNKIYNYKKNDFGKDEIVRVRIGNLLSFLGTSVSLFYSIIYLFYFNSFYAFSITILFAFLYLSYFYFLSKMQIIKARLSFFIILFVHLFLATVLLISTKSGIQYYYLLVPPIAYLVFAKEKELRFSISLTSLLLLILCHFLGEKYHILVLSETMFDILYVLTLTVIFSVFIILFNTFLEEIKKKEEKLENLSSIDYLTNILNRRAFYTKAEEMIELSKRYENNLGLLIFDIDFFKKINDNYGHNIGDLVLQHLSKEVSLKIRNTDCFARFGGEEFIILIPNISKEQLSVFAEKIRKTVEDIEVKNDSKIIKFTVSIGITLYNKDEEIENFINRADIAMYKSKENGRNQVSSKF